jgi:ABC-type branched-subunit amino acid transport system ATPase component
LADSYSLRILASSSSCTNEATLSASLLIVEQKVNELLDIAHRVYSLKLGKVAFSGKAEELRRNNEKLRELFL